MMKSNIRSKWITGMFASVLVVMLLVSGSAWAANPSWKVASGNWNVAANWNYGLPATNTGYAAIRNGGTATVTTAETYPNYLYIGASGTGDGTCVLNAGGTLTGGVLILGYGSTLPGATATFIQNGGTNSQDAVRVGSDIATGYYSLIDGTLDSGYVYVGYTGQGVFTQSGGENKLRTGKQLIVGSGVAATGTYNLNGGKVVLDDANMMLGSSGTGTINQTAGIYSNATASTYVGYNAGSKGTYNLSGGRIFTKGLNVGYNGTGSFIQSGGTNTVNYDLNIGAKSGGVGCYEMSGGELYVTAQWHDLNVGLVAGSTGTFVQVGGTVYVTNSQLRIGDNGSCGTYRLGGNGRLELANNEYIFSGGTFIQTGGVHNIGGSLSVKTNGVFRGWGVVKTSYYRLFNNGIIVADGYGDVDRSLVITNYDRLYIENANPPDGTNGYYAVHHGKLTLVPLPTSGSYQEWGDYGSKGLVNTVKISDFLVSDSGVLSGSLYATDHSEVPIYGRSAKIAGIWGFNDSIDSVVGTVDMRFRYDHVAVSVLGLDEATLKVFYHAGGENDDWEEITDLTRDVAAHTITINDVNPVGFFAIGEALPGDPKGTVITIK